MTLELLVRVIGAVDWQKIRKGKRDTYLHLYEHFLDLYDNDLRKQSGTYYTPREVVEPMVRLVHDALVTRLDKPLGFRDEQVLTLDPAVGTGTYLQTILERAADDVEISDGPGARRKKIVTARRDARCAMARRMDHRIPRSADGP